MSNKKQSTQKTLMLAQLGVLSGLILVMTFVPYLGYISYGALSITLIHIPVIIGAVVMGPKAGAILGGVWGTACIVKALVAPPSPLEGMIFWNPLVSLLPRVLAGAVAGWIFLLVYKKLKAPQAVASGCAAILGAGANTILVLGALYLLYGTKFGADLGINIVSFGGLFKYLFAAFAGNGGIEIIVGAVLVIPISAALRKVKTRIA